MSKQALHTKFGVAYLWGRYYNVNNPTNGSSEMKLHRLIWEDFYGCEIPDGYVIHHKNGNNLDNCILNLQLMREDEHKKLHGFPFMENTTGYFRVSKQINEKYKQGFRWRYQYVDSDGKPKSIWAVDINKLKEKVLNKGLEWKEL